MRFFLGVLFLVMGSLAHASSSVSTPDIWRTHLENDLLPFWNDPYATGNPPGAFAPRLCNDGSEPVAACSGVTASQAAKPIETLVAQSRQVFSYAIAFHMTGNSVYLDLAKAGTAHQFDTLLDGDTGLFHEKHNLTTGRQFGGFDVQKQAYGLLGPSFLYYLTGDSALYNQIASVEDAITTTYRISATGAYKSKPDATDPATSIAKHLDQLNAYKTLLAAQAPLADLPGMLQDALQTAYYLKDAFFDPATDTMRPRLTTGSGDKTRDFGHAIKAYWFMDQTAQLAGDTALAAFAQSAAKSLLKQAFDEDAGAWITNVDSSGNRVPDASWWGFAELNQFAASLAIEDPELRDMLSKTQAYWLTHFVDPMDQGIWGFVNIDTNTPDTDYAKHWEWKAGFHSYEHALINYLTAGAISGDTLDLYFARPDAGAQGLAYGFSGNIDLLEPVGTGGTSPDVFRAQLSGLSYAAVAPVPLPAASGLLLAGAAALGLMARRRARSAIS